MILSILLIVGFIAGIFIPQNTVLKVGIYLFIPSIVTGLIIPTFRTETDGIFFMVLAMSVGFITIFTLLGGFVASLVKRMFNKGDSK